MAEKTVEVNEYFDGRITYKPNEKKLVLCVVPKTDRDTTWLELRESDVTSEEVDVVSNELLEKAERKMRNVNEAIKKADLQMEVEYGPVEEKAFLIQPPGRKIFTIHGKIEHRGETEDYFISVESYNRTITEIDSTKVVSYIGKNYKDYVVFESQGADEETVTEVMEKTKEWYEEEVDKVLDGETEEDIAQEKLDEMFG